MNAVERRGILKQPFIRSMDGEDVLCFTYNNKNDTTNTYTIKFNIGDADISSLSEKFKSDNCVYPKANIIRNEYKGNRWEYENNCNRLAWKFVVLNREILYGKKGLIQRAVDTYRSINKLSRSRRIIKNERKLDCGNYRKSRIYEKFIEIKFNGEIYRINAEIKNIKFNAIPERFKIQYSLFGNNYALNNICIKIAYKNKNSHFFCILSERDLQFLLKDATKEIYERPKGFKTSIKYTEEDFDSCEGRRTLKKTVLNRMESVKNFKQRRN